MIPKKSFGQHWLNDAQALGEIEEAADISPGEHVLEVGSGQGSLTEMLLGSGAFVTAVEVDKEAYKYLLDETRNFYSADLPCLNLVNEDILKFDLSTMPKGYKVVANIPYYLTSKLLRMLCESSNPPAKMVLLVQKEVAQRIAAKPGQMSILAVSVQLYYKPSLGIIVPPELFEPPPKVDSQVVILDRHSKPLFQDLDEKKFFKVVKAGFSEKRKKLRSSLAGGLAISREEADQKAKSVGIDAGRRAQELSIEEWAQLAKVF